MIISIKNKQNIFMQFKFYSPGHYQTGTFKAGVQWLLLEWGCFVLFRFILFCILCFCYHFPGCSHLCTCGRSVYIRHTCLDLLKCFSLQVSQVTYAHNLLKHRQSTIQWELGFTVFDWGVLFQKFLSLLMGRRNTSLSLSTLWTRPP